MFLNKIQKIQSALMVLSCLILVPVSYAAGNSYKVKPTDNLSKILDRFYKDSELSRYQVYIGLLAENPDAFRLGNINYLKNGYLLNLPDSASLLAMEPKDAANLIAEHNDNAKRGKRINIDPPFGDYSPKSNSMETDLLEKSALTEKQQKTSEKLDKMDSEREELRFKLEQLVADKKAMDAELLQLNSLLEK